MTSSLLVEDATAIAEKAAMKHFARYVEQPPLRWISENFLEASNCWLFLRDNDVMLNEYGRVSADAAIVVSKKGKVMIVADHNRDMEKLRQYLSNVSKYLADRNE
jgi:hypothetical protein